MNKPFSIMHEEFKQELTNLINNSNLPISVVEYILQNYLIEANSLAKSQYQTDKVRYEKFLKKENENKIKEENNNEIKNAG